MFTIAVILFGIKLINWHMALPPVVNQVLGLLTAPIEWQPSFGAVRLDIVLGADNAVTPAAGSRAVTSVTAGTIVSTPAHADVISTTPTTPTPADSDNVEPTFDQSDPVDAATDPMTGASLPQAQMPWMKPGTSVPANSDLEKALTGSN